MALLNAAGTGATGSVVVSFTNAQATGFVGGGAPDSIRVRWRHVMSLRTLVRAATTATATPRASSSPRWDRETLDEYLFEALRHGAGGFLVEDTEPSDLVTAIEVVAAGDSLISPGMTRRLVAEFAARAEQPRVATELTVLTEREREVMALVAGGLTNGEIARCLYLSPATIRTHVGRATTKLGARGRTHWWYWPTRAASSGPAGASSRPESLRPAA